MLFEVQHVMVPKPARKGQCPNSAGAYEACEQPHLVISHTNTSGQLFSVHPPKALHRLCLSW